MTARSPHDEKPLLLSLTEEVARIAASLADLSKECEAKRQSLEPKPKDVTPDISGPAVDFVIRSRRERARYFPGDLFSEPAWDIMLELLRSEIKGERVTLSELSVAAGVPTTTALRWIATMFQRGMLVRECDRFDGPTFVKLEAETSGSLRRYFAEVVQAG